MNIRGWTQTCDYTSKELGTVSLEEAVQAIRTFSWEQEFQAFADRLLANEDACPPGIGFNSPDDRFMFHLAAFEKDEWELTLSLPRPRSDKFLGIFRKRDYELNIPIHSVDESLGLLKLFFEGNVDQLLTEAKNRSS